MGRPATGQTPVRTVRIGAAWDEAVSNLANGETMTQLIEKLLRRHNQAEARKLRTPQPRPGGTAPED